MSSSFVSGSFGVGLNSFGGCFGSSVGSRGVGGQMEQLLTANLFQGFSF